MINFDNVTTLMLKEIREGHKNIFLYQQYDDNQLSLKVLAL